MNVEWSDLFAALALYLILEGLVLFASPAAFKRVLGRLAQLGDGELRRNGLIAVVIGLAVLMWVR
ncbi:MAG: DUF2065 domain-containing protein [Steroidobacteraceae bacterium]|nr:DUF2065 domain-containing protein [Steroidobacteraceae bacterium]MDW8260388.1 DUF2065 domain-containing protein [Gammaproteobacteria bacterium]